MNSVYANLSRDYTGIETFKRSVEEQLGGYLPEDSFAIIVRNYGGDIRSQNHKETPLKCIIMLQPEGRAAAVRNKSQLEVMGYQVAPDGRLTLP